MSLLPWSGNKERIDYLEAKVKRLGNELEANQVIEHLVNCGIEDKLIFLLESVDDLSAQVKRLTKRVDVNSQKFSVLKAWVEEIGKRVK